MTSPTLAEANRHPLIRFSNWLRTLPISRGRPWFTLDEDDLIREAQRKTNCDDFGSEHFREPLHVLIEAIREECRLTPTGKYLLYNLLLRGLCSRLCIQREVQAHPEILDQPIKRPLIIVGAPRTGTTLLNYLLSQDPVSRPLLGWEGVNLVPEKAGQDWSTPPRRILLRTAYRERIGKWVAPELAAMHPFGWNLPDECHWLVSRSFMFPAWVVLAPYHEWLMQQPDTVYDRAYNDYRLALQVLEWQRPARGHWVLKSPLHLWALGSIAKAVPEASFIQTHRSLESVIPSMCNVAASLMRLASDAVEPKKMGPVAMRLTEETIERFTRARTTFSKSRIVDLPFQDLIADPVAAVKQIYMDFEYEFTPEFEHRMKAFLADGKQLGSARHAYSLDQYGLEKEAITREFDAYHQKYGLV